MADPLNNTNKYLLLSLSLFVMCCVGSITFLRCTSDNDHRIPLVEKKSEIKGPNTFNSSFFGGVDLAKDGKSTTLSASSMIDNFSVKSFKAYVKGSSSLKDWESKLNNVECKEQDKSKAILIKIPVKDIKGNEGKIMDDKTYAAFKGDEFPFITFSFKESQIKIDEDERVEIETTGNLTMAGTTKQINISGSGKVLENKDLSINISKKMKMTDFNIDPPSVALGTIKVKDEITVVFDIVLSKLSKGK